jgi:PAS domain S-box-containing protein
MKSTLRHSLLAGFVAALALLGLVAGFNWHYAARTQETAAWVAHTHEVRDQLNKALSSMQDVETGERGFVLTGIPAFLEPYHAAVEGVAARVRSLRTLTADNPEQRQILDALELHIKRKLDHSALVVQLRRDAGFALAQAEVVSGRGKAAMDAVRADITRMDTVEDTLLMERAATARREADTTRRLTLAGSSLSFLLLIAVFALVLRENRLRQRAEDEVDRFFSVALDMLCVSSSDGYFKRLNPAFSQTLGWSNEEMLARPYLDFIHPDDYSATLQEVERQIAAKKAVFNFENRYRHKDGSWRWLSWKSVPQPGGLMYATARDITERKQVEEKLATTTKALADFKAALDAHGIISIADVRGKILHVNDNFCAISKYSREELLGQDHRLINSGHHPKAFIRDLWQTITSGRVWKGEIRNRAKDGSFYWVDTVIMPIIEANGKPSQFISTRSDITERKLAEEQVVQLDAELHAHAAQLEAANKELESFAYSVSHDLRAPLRGMDGFSQALLEDYEGQLDATGQDYLRRVRAGAQHMGQLIDDLLSLSLVTRSEMTLDPVNLTALARKVIAELQPQQAGRAVQWEVSDPLNARGDPRLLQLALVNLLANALKFTGKCEQARIEFGQQVQGTEPVFFVRDNGAGFDMAYADRLFGAFQRLHTRLEFPGTGIGLATVQRIIHRHGGRVWAEAQPGKGATFYFTLPTAE